jgi:hypothetical protein
MPKTPTIENSYFGGIIIDGRKYDNDVLVAWHGEVATRHNSHEFTKKDLNDILLHDPEIIIIGNGNVGNMKLDPAVEVAARLKGVELLVAQTPIAVQEFNKVAKRRKAIGVFHITC